MVYSRAGRQVYCLITDKWGYSVETDVVTISAIPETKLTITTQPEDVSAAMGEEFTVTVEAEGDNVAYQWYWYSNVLKNWQASIHRDNTYDFEMVSSRADRQVYCVISDGWGNTMTTDIVTIWLKEEESEEESSGQTGESSGETSDGTTGDTSGDDDGDTEGRV